MSYICENCHSLACPPISSDDSSSSDDDDDALEVSSSLPLELFADDPLRVCFCRFTRLREFRIKYRTACAGVRLAMRNDAVRATASLYSTEKRLSVLSSRRNKESATQPHRNRVGPSASSGGACHRNARHLPHQALPVTGGKACFRNRACKEAYNWYHKLLLELLYRDVTSPKLAIVNVRQTSSELETRSRHSLETHATRPSVCGSSL